MHMVLPVIDTSVDVFGLPVCTRARPEVESMLCEWLSQRRGRMVITLNPEIALQCQSNPALRQSVKQASIIVPDGFGVIWAVRRLYGKRLERIPGIELASDMLRASARVKAPVFFLGGRKGIAEKAAAFWLGQCPDLVVVGTHHGYVDPPQEEALIRRIEATQPALLLVGMGAGKQEQLMAHLSPNSFGVAIGIGGSMEIWAGEKRRAPAWMRAASLEWAYRVACEPRRLTRLARTFPFFGRVLWNSLRRHAS
jgi:N-acetylglucosaminyldiphosphoundecaprenol N-acetyl-beta-D-mannosaminyltransferase